MLCQKCGKRTANVHYKQVINGAVKEEFLCSECAASGNMNIPFEKGADELFGNLFAGASAFSGRGKSVCPLCGASVRDISVSGKVGCAKCYEVFKNELQRTVVGIHGNVHHVGRAPGKHKETMELQAKLDALRAEQQKAIEEQNFELAAELRDKINQLSANGSEKVKEGE